jgi:hypothetical protein
MIEFIKRLVTFFKGQVVMVSSVDVSIIVKGYVALNGLGIIFCFQESIGTHG